MQKKGKHCAHCWRRSTNKQNKHKKTRFTLGSQLFLLSFFFFFQLNFLLFFGFLFVTETSRFRNGWSRIIVDRKSAIIC